MDRTFKVVSKGLFGKHETPMIKLKNDSKESMSLKLASKADLSQYPIETILTVKISQEQKRIA